MITLFAWYAIRRRDLPLTYSFALFGLGPLGVAKKLPYVAQTFVKDKVKRKIPPVPFEALLRFEGIQGRRHGDRRPIAIRPPLALACGRPVCRRARFRAPSLRDSRAVPGASAARHLLGLVSRPGPTQEILEPASPGAQSILGPRGSYPRWSSPGGSAWEPAWRAAAAASRSGGRPRAYREALLGIATRRSS